MKYQVAFFLAGMVVAIVAWVAIAPAQLEPLELADARRSLLRKEPKIIGMKISTNRSIRE